MSNPHKRLSQVDEGKVVIEQRVETPALSTQFTDKGKDKLVNKTDKLSLYLEAMVKAYIIAHSKLYSGIDELLDGKLWYNREEVLVLFGRLIELMRLSAVVKAEKLPGVRAKLNGEIKRVIGEWGANNELL